MSTLEIKVPDIGDFKDVPIIQVFVKPGDAVKAEDPLISLESDKATMDVPSPAAGTVKDLRVKVGDRVSEGKVILVLDAETAGDGKAAKPAGGNGASAGPAAATAAPAPRPAEKAAPPVPAEKAAPPASAEKAAPAREAPAPAAPPAAAPAPAPQPPIEGEAFRKAHASPSVRKFARELGVDLSRVAGSGPKDRILQTDVQAFVKQAMSGAAAGAPAGAFALSLPPWPKVDFSKFGPVEVAPLSRIKKISGANLARNWVMIPHVTQFDEADITDLEALRVEVNKENENAGIKLTLLAFLHFHPVGDPAYGAFSPPARIAVLVGQIVVPSLGGPLLERLAFRVVRAAARGRGGRFTRPRHTRPPGTGASVDLSGKGTALSVPVRNTA